MQKNKNSEMFMNIVDLIRMQNKTTQYKYLIDGLCYE